MGHHKTRLLSGEYASLTKWGVIRQDAERLTGEKCYVIFLPEVR